MLNFKKRADSAIGDASENTKENCEYYVKTGLEKRVERSLKKVYLQGVADGRRSVINQLADDPRFSRVKFCRITGRIVKVSGKLKCSKPNSQKIARGLIL